MLDPFVLTLIAALLLSVAVLSHHRATRGVVVLTVRDGAVIRVRGTIPAPVLTDVREVLAGSGARGTIRAIDGGGRTAKIELEGAFSPQVSQRIRNVLGTVPVSRLRQGPRR
jgi:hypothetical protein